MGMQSIDLSALKKKQFCIDGDENRIVELDTSDLKLITRFEKMYPTLIAEGEKVGQIQDMISEDNINTEGISRLMEEIDKTMREAVDYIFDSPVCAVCVPSGSMFDPVNGEYKFEHIINALVPLYETNLVTETKKIQTRIKKHTDKYVKKSSK